MSMRIELDETGYYFAEIPEFPGCHSQGKTVEEARANLLEALTVWLEVMHEKSSMNYETPK